MAMAFAMACNCFELAAVAGRCPPDNAPMAPCGKCRSCMKISSGNHPDVIWIRPSGAMIKVDQIRTLCGKLTLKPYEANVRFAIISDAHKLNPEAGNTLLKTLEEPPAHTVFILTALQTSDLLPTIVSRCRPIRFNPLSVDSLTAYLEKAHGLERGKAAAAAAMAGGSITRAESMMSMDWIRKRLWIIEETEALPSRPVNLSLAFSEALSKNKESVFTAFEIMKNWLRDLVVYPAAPGKIINKDLEQKISASFQKASKANRLQKIKAIERAEADIRSNANLRLTLDALIMTLSMES